MKTRPSTHSLRTQIITSSIILVLITAAVAGLPALWLIREQLDSQAWSQIEQGYRAAQSLYASKKVQIAASAALIAQSHDLQAQIQQGDQPALEDNLRSIQSSRELDLVVVCDSNQSVLAAAASSQIPDGICDPRPDGSFYMVRGQALPQVWLMAAHSMVETPNGAASIVAGVRLDNEFAEQMHSQTGLEHSLLANDQVVATSLASSPPVEAEAAPRTSILTSPDVVVCCTYELSDQAYYAARLPLDGPGIQAEIALPVSEIHAAQRTFGLLWAGSMLLVAGLGSVLSVIRARQISRPLTSLADAANRFSQGDLLSPVQADTQVREVVQVSQALEQARLDLSKNLTALQGEKAWVEHLLASIVEGIVTLDEDNRITFFSRGAEQITGWSQAEALHRSCDDVFRISEGDSTFSQCLPLPGQKTQVVIQAADRQVVLAITRALLTPPDALGPEIALVFRDVSEEVTIHRLLGYFIANIAHEFRTPLSALAASIELLMDQAPDFSAAEVDELLKSLHLGVLSLQTLVDNLLESASIEAGHFRVSPRPNDLTRMIHEAVEVMHPLLEKYGQRIQVEMPATLPEILADPRRIVQVLVNLLSNASRYGPADDEITLTAGEQGEQVMVTVADRGPGVSTQHRELLFRRFEYPASPDAQSKVGAGLGLSVVKAIVEAHGGKTGVDDRPGGGSIFWFTLPKANKK